MDARRSRFASSDIYITRKRRIEFFLQKAALRPAMARLADRVEHKCPETVEQKTEARIVESRCVLEEFSCDNTRRTRSVRDENEQKVEAECFQHFCSTNSKSAAAATKLRCRYTMMAHTTNGSCSISAIDRKVSVFRTHDLAHRADMLANSLLAC